MPDSASPYIQLARTILREAEQQIPRLRNPECQPVFLLHPQATSKVCLLFHGFTGAPFQFAALAKILFKAGYNVLVPLLPGHGLKGDWGPFKRPPLPNDAQTYEDFAQFWLQRARSLGQKLVIGGLSGGGTLAAWLALEHPRAIDKTILLAPYLGSSKHTVDQQTRLINRYQEWLRPSSTTNISPSNLPPKNQAFQPSGYGGFEVNALRVFLEMGEDVLRRSQYEDTASLFIVSSAGDRPQHPAPTPSNQVSGRAAPDREHRLLFDRVLRYQPHTWMLDFEHVQDIPHTMLTLDEDNPHLFMLMRVAKGYIESDLTWAEVAEVGHRMARGQAFAAAVQQLGLSQRVSPDMPTVMTLMDKQQFLGLRQRQRVLR